MRLDMPILLQRAVLGFVIFFIIISCTPLETWWTRALESPWADSPPAVLLVLGGDEQGPGVVGYSTYLRLEYTVKFWQTGKVRRIVLSGAGSGLPTLAEAMRNYLQNRGVPPDMLVMEPHSTSTLENIRESKALLQTGGEPVGLVTSDFHSGRAWAVARREGLDVVPLPIPDVLKRSGAWSERWPLFWLLTTETAKRFWYRYQGWT
jgi:uncharacterized SAM-binding protein YcdF (DUF218 family)